MEELQKQIHQQIDEVLTEAMKRGKNISYQDVMNVCLMEQIYLLQIRIDYLENINRPLI